MIPIFCCFSLERENVFQFFDEISEKRESVGFGSERAVSGSRQILFPPTNGSCVFFLVNQGEKMYNNLRYM